MKKIIPFLALLLFGASYKTQAQCTPVDCSGSLPAYGGICDTILLNGRVNTSYSDFESFVLTQTCFDAGLIDPSQAGNSIKITNVDNFTYAGMPTGIVAATDANSYTPPSSGNVRGCVRFQGTPTQIGVFKNYVNFLADVRLCTFPFLSLNNNAAGYGLRMTVLPDPAFTGLASTYCTNDAAATLTVTGTSGGTFSGPGITGSTFNPATAGVGTHTIKYVVSRQEGAAIAPAADSMMVTVTVTAPSFTYYLDNDNDGYGQNGSTIVSCASSAPTGYASVGMDCNDANNQINPARPEVCNGLDDNCNVTADEFLTVFTYYVDADSDGFGTSVILTSCLGAPPTGYAAVSGDCNDGNAAIHPGAAEVCDGIDNNCVGGIDEGLTLTTYYRDADNDTYGDLNVTTTTCALTPPTGYVANSTDCDDTDENINPGEVEIPGNSVDENCDNVDGAVDNDSDTFDSTVDCDDNNNTVYPGAPELCDGIDNNCIGGIDEGLTLNTYYLDSDNDGYGSSTTTTTCALTPPTGYVSNNTDCNDTDENIHPGATEICDGLDNDCDGGIDLLDLDAGLTTYTYFIDADDDGYGAGIAMLSCSPVAPTGYAANNTDCNDANDAIHPGATEICDGIDNDCNGFIDLADPDGNLTTYTYYVDADNDTYGSSTAITSCNSIAPTGYVSNNTDCDDNNAAIHPGATEVCDGVDNDCTNGVDDGLTTTTYYRDVDGDGYGNTAIDSVSCVLVPPTGYVLPNGDCDDTNDAIFPGNAEVCDGLDNDCANGVDDGLGLNTYYRDFDTDGFGDITQDSTSCSLIIPVGYVSNNQDCNDANLDIYPGATEIPNNGIDEDCNGTDLVGLNTIEAQFGINLFPNPANEFIVLAGKLNDNMVVTIYDLQGKQLITHALTQGTNYILNITGLNPGYYMVEVTNKATAQRGFSRIVVVR